MSNPRSSLLLCTASLAFLLLIGCKQTSDSGAEVLWPELSALDVPSAKAEGLAKKKQVDALRTMMPELAGLASSVTEESIPGNATNPEPTRILVGDLANLASQAKEAGSLDDETLLAVGAAFHPLVAKLMEESGMPHLHEGEGPNGGYLHPLKAKGEEIGQIEIKLHDDAGDLEVWLTLGQTGDATLDLPLDTIVQIDFPEMEGRTVELKVRNTEKNEDENGASTIRDGKTNYFIFPGESGSDAAWLMGKDFSTPISVTISTGETSYQAGPFDLKPHVH